MISFQNFRFAALAVLWALGPGCARDAASREAPSGGMAPAMEAIQPKAEAALPAAARAPPQFDCGNWQVIRFGPDIPPDFSQVSVQIDADCFAWQQFIALNWPAAGMDGGTAEGFGTPGDLAAVQWQTYMSTGQLFPPDAGPPPPWGTQPEVTDDCLAEAGLTQAQAKGRLPLMVASKFAEQFDPGKSSAQAYPRGAPAWLGAQNGTNVWYDVKVNLPEYQYIVDAGLYNAANQVAMADAGVPLVLPQGAFQPSPGTVGAIELKAAWMEVTSPADARWNAYKLAAAVVVDPSTQKCRQATVALVGLHIIHATQSQPTLIWSTFEHVANAPLDGADAGTTEWNFYNPQCQPRTLQLPPTCAADGKATHVTVGCTPNTAPPYYIGEGCPAPVPVQVTRMNPIDQNAQTVNQLVHQNIGTSYPGSVWQNYILVNVLWSSKSSPSPAKPVQVPLPFAAPMPSSTIPIANTTMETYIQQTADFGQGQQASNCIVCHKNAAIAGNSRIASDFSFVFTLASGLPPSPVPKSRKLTAKQKAAVAHPPTMRRILR